MTGKQPKANEKNTKEPRLEIFTEDSNEMFSLNVGKNVINSGTTPVHTTISQLMQWQSYMVDENEQTMLTMRAYNYQRIGVYHLSHLTQHPVNS